MNKRAQVHSCLAVVLVLEIMLVKATISISRDCETPTGKKLKTRSHYLSIPRLHPSFIMSAGVRDFLVHG